MKRIAGANRETRAVGAYTKEVQAKNINEDALALRITTRGRPMSFDEVWAGIPYPRKVVKAKLDAMVRKRVINEGPAGYTANDVFHA